MSNKDGAAEQTKDAEGQNPDVPKDWPQQKKWLGDRICNLVLENERLKSVAGTSEIGDWRIDTSAGRPILVYKNCSVIEDEQARYVLNLIAASKEGAAQVEAAEGAKPALSDAQTRTAFRYYDGRGEAQFKTPWQLWRDAAAWAQHALATPPASPSEGVGEQIAHIKQAIYTISGGDFDATDDEARRIAEAVLSLSPSRGERTAHCGNDACNWKGPISECCYLGSIGPCCPECREIGEPEPRGEAVDARYQELLYAVARKHPGETRHQTALRYIRQAEASTGGKQATQSQGAKP